MTWPECAEPTICWQYSETLLLDKFEVQTCSANEPRRQMHNLPLQRVLKSSHELVSDFKQWLCWACKLGMTGTCEWNAQPSRESSFQHESFCCIHTLRTSDIITHHTLAIAELERFRSILVKTLSGPDKAKWQTQVNHRSTPCTFLRHLRFRGSLLWDRSHPLVRSSPAMTCWDPFGSNLAVKKIWYHGHIRFIQLYRNSFQFQGSQLHFPRKNTYPSIAWRKLHRKVQDTVRHSRTQQSFSPKKCHL